MKFPGFSHPMSGVAVPVSALRSKKSFGIGEFADLPVLGKFCGAAGLDVIQILPVNDTGSQPSPYSALSAYALHPVYIRLEDLPELRAGGAGAAGLKALAAEIRKSRKAAEAGSRVDFYGIWKTKLDFLGRIYREAAGEIRTDAELEKWIQANPWIKPYSLFCVLKEKNNGAPWTAWREFREVSEKDIENAWGAESGKQDLVFHAWLQMRLEEQFRAAAGELDRQGVFLKGDIPIMMSEDSADVWAHPHLFICGLRAGAPPDMYSPVGQNWGFPIYDWEELAKSGYSWWKKRLHRADLFYHAYRIDHVLGFFRVWVIPEHERQGVLGYFKPSRYISRDELRAAGFDEGRIRWMSRPHVAGDLLRGIFGAEIPERIFTRVGSEDLYLFREDVNESCIWDLGLPDEKTRKLIAFYQDRMLIETGPDGFAPAWFRDSSKAWNSLSGGEKEKAALIIRGYFRDSEDLWAREGERLLRFMKEETSMLPCAEDLGVVPDCVPGVLGRLGILGLRIPRWVRRYRESGEPFIPPAEYPRLTVCAASVHDTSTVREWWETENDRGGLWRALGLSTADASGNSGGQAPSAYSPETAERIFGGLLGAQSVLVMFQFQDFFALEPDLRVENAADERINVPGTVADTNWSYRMPFTLEDFDAGGGLAKRIHALVKKRADGKPA
ncbi:MAG: 4-alpha-glucanotransferase [Spirochaetales bacterium]|jgi:4-alpha-glucanotransferase|nr:4-alpha-glucanotransferase [Spirochaetales bacterium]